MHLLLRADAEKPFENQMGVLAPWMHPFKFGERTFTGYFKYEGLDSSLTWVNSSSPDADVSRLRAAYEFQDHALWPAFLRQMCDAAIPESTRGAMTVLDVGTATGRNSLLAVDLGFGRVIASEIRANQSAQTRLILDSLQDEKYRERISVVHDPRSADDPSYAERYEPLTVDVAMSLGVLYHLANPVQHLLNLKRIARRYAIVYTMTHYHPFAKRMWWLDLEASGWITKATSGVSWTPHYLEVARLCRAVGFKAVSIMYPPMFERHFTNYREASRSTDLALAAAMVVHRSTGRHIGALRNHDFNYFKRTGLNPNYFGYVCEA